MSHSQLGRKTVFNQQQKSEIVNKAYAQVANISKGEARFRATGTYPLNPYVLPSKTSWQHR